MTHGQTETQADRYGQQKDRQAHGQTNCRRRQTDRQVQTDRHRQTDHRQRDKYTDRQTGRQTDRHQPDRHTERHKQRERQTERQTERAQIQAGSIQADTYRQAQADSHIHTCTYTYRQT